MELPKPPQGINVICNSRRYDVLNFCSWFGIGTPFTMFPCYTYVVNES